MRIEDYKRIMFVKAHKGWSVKLKKFMESSVVPGLWEPTVDNFISAHARDIDASMRIIADKKAGQTWLRQSLFDPED